MEKKICTIKDIAKELKISASTVSRALNNHSSIKKETVRLIKALAEKLNYRPNLMALNLLQKKTNTIAIVVPEITGHFFSTAITAIEDVFILTQYNVIVFLSNESYKQELYIIDKLGRIQIDGVLVSPSSKTKKFDHFRSLQNSGVPIVVFDRDCKGFDADKVLVDDYFGAYQAVEYLIRAGCTRIGHIGGPKDISTSIQRLNGYLDALKNNNIQICNEYIEHTSGCNIEDGVKAAKKILRLEKTPDAIFTVNDNIAISVMRTAEKLKFKIPEDILIIGFDDEPHSAYFSPALSSVWQPIYDMGMLSARILLNRLSFEYTSNDFRLEVFKPELIIRDSSKLIL
ncbi:MAG: LacI family DNA-binding transcriptional regulator [Bacteroidetes bacterium]|nr:LacI family DNA-binding transcriptional regulator [Bacteroidota bacterium]